jgi:hypothetical protein
MSGRSWSALTLIWSIAGCAYYNAMWSAERYASDARHLEERGQASEARSQWALAAAKAEGVVRRHPRSRWADDALVLQVEGMARSGQCQDADEPRARARTGVKEPALRERIELAAAECALAVRRPAQAEAALALPLASQNGGRRSRAEYVAGEAALQQLDYDAAVKHFERSREPTALPALVRAQLLAGRTTEATAALDAIDNGARFESDRPDLLAQLAASAGPEAASVALDRMIRRTRLPLTEQAKLLIADGDRLLAHVAYDAAATRYRRAAAIAPAGTPEAGLALVGQQRVSIARASERSELPPIAAELTRILRVEAGGAAAKHWLDLLSVVILVPETPGMRFRMAEVARDSLSAPALAGQLFLDVAAGDTGSLYAPKALVAALVLLPDHRDSIAQVLDTRYAASPYTRVFHGEPSVAYAAAEDSLARELGVQLAHSTSAPSEARFDAPIPGPRGPWLDEPERARAAGSEVRPARAQPRPPNATRPVPDRDRPKQPERP